MQYGIKMGLLIERTQTEESLMLGVVQAAITLQRKGVRTFKCGEVFELSKEERDAIIESAAEIHRRELGDIKRALNLAELGIWTPGH